MHKQVKRFLRSFDTEHKVKAPKVRNKISSLNKY